MSFQLKKLAFIASNTPEAQAGLEELVRLYGNLPVEEADVIVALGGDGFMLQTLHETITTGKSVYGMNRGSVGFLMNGFRPENLHERVGTAVGNDFHPLRMTTTNVDGSTDQALAINEVYLFRQSYQAAKLRVEIDGHVRLEELICDGLMIATPAGSTAYNLSAHGPILPLEAPLLAMTPVSAFRPRRWRGALLPNHVCVDIHILEADKRPVNAVGGQYRSQIHPACARRAVDGTDGPHPLRSRPFLVGADSRRTVQQLIRRSRSSRIVLDVTPGGRRRAKRCGWRRQPCGRVPLPASCDQAAGRSGDRSPEATYTGERRAPGRRYRDNPHGQAGRGARRRPGFFLPGPYSFQVSNSSGKRAPSVSTSLRSQRPFGSQIALRSSWAEKSVSSLSRFSGATGKVSSTRKKPALDRSVISATTTLKRLSLSPSWL